MLLLLNVSAIVDSMILMGSSYVTADEWDEKEIDCVSLEPQGPRVCGELVTNLTSDWLAKGLPLILCT